MTDGLHHSQLTHHNHNQHQHHNQLNQLDHDHEQLHQSPQLQPSLNSACFQTNDPNEDDPSENHISQMHRLRLYSQSNTQHHHYMSSSICMHSDASTMPMNIPNCSDVGDSYNISSSLGDHHHHLQTLSSAPYDPLDPSNAISGTSATSASITTNTDTSTNNHMTKQDNEALLSSSLENHAPPLTSSSLHSHHHISLSSRNAMHHQSQLLSSSLTSSSNIGLSVDLDSELAYKSSLDSQSAILSRHSDDSGNSSNNDNPINKQSNSSSSSKSKLNTPRRNAWGNMSYADLISQAINSTNDKRLTLSQIYDWMVQHVPYFKDKGDSNSSAGWKNSVRHNLSLHNRFKRIQNEGTGKSSWWTINPEANIGKCARRRAASMEASKFERKRRGAKKKADAIRSGLLSFQSSTPASLPSSFSLEQNLHLATRSSSISANQTSNNLSEKILLSESLHNLHQKQPQTQVLQSQQQQQQQQQPPPPQAQQQNTLQSQQHQHQQQQQQQQQQQPQQQATMSQTTSSPIHVPLPRPCTVTCDSSSAMRTHQRIII